MPAKTGRTQRRYSAEYREKVLRKLARGKKAVFLCCEEDVSESVLSNWKRAAKKSGLWEQLLAEAGQARAAAAAAPVAIEGPPPRVHAPGRAPMLPPEAPEFGRSEYLGMGAYFADEMPLQTERMGEGQADPGFWGAGIGVWAGKE